MTANSFNMEKYIDDYSKIQSYRELNLFMTNAIQKRLPSPLYGFDDESDNTDNYWWNPDDPRYRLLVRINQLGIITLGAEEGILEGEDLLVHYKDTDVIGVNSRCSLTFICPNSYVDHIKRWFSKYIVITSDAKRLLGKEECRPRCLIVNKDASVKEISWFWFHREDQTNLYSKEWDTLTLFDPLDPNVAAKIKSEVTSFDIIDPVWNRIAYGRDGIFTQIVQCLEAIDRP